MRKIRFTESQIVDALKRAEAGVQVKALCRELQISSATFYQWRSKYGGVEVSRLKRGLWTERTKKKRDLSSRNRLLLKHTTREVNAFVKLKNNVINVNTLHRSHKDSRCGERTVL